ncbi:MAG: amidohydrolase [Deltaproteobacteria bacterium]|nr:amidohydrolase [Deltaproteobacteria bacterium]
MEEKNGRRSFLKYAFSLSAFAAGSALSINKGNGFSIGKSGSAEAQTKKAARLKKIAVEEHFHTKEYLEMLSSRTNHQGEGAAHAAAKVVDMGEGRIKEMDECGVDMQMLSLSYPGLDVFKTEDAVTLSRMINDHLSGVIKKYPTRFSGFCCMPLQDPNVAADELERAVTKLGLKAAMVNINTPERWLSDPQYEVVFERLSRLDVPFYLHADGPSTDDSGLHIVPEVMRIVNGNLLDKYPNLKLILGHAGESLPFWLNRLDGRWRYPDRPKIFSQYFKDNFYVSTSSQCSDTLLNFLIAELGADRILFATDYPYESMKQHVDFIDSAPISNEDREKICHINAERLFKL